MVFTKTREKKIPTEKLQEDYLNGPADESIQDVAKELKENQVVVAVHDPCIEKITFRNQRDPGYPLEFHYASATHPFKQYKLIDGQDYELPREVILNLESCRENIHKYRKSREGIPEVYIAGYKTHFVCERT